MRMSPTSSTSANEVTKINASVDQLMDVPDRQLLINTFKTDDKRRSGISLKRSGRRRRSLQRSTRSWRPLPGEPRTQLLPEAITADAKGHLVELIMEDGFKETLKS